MLNVMKHPPDMAELVVDASALVDLLLRNDVGVGVADRLIGHGLHAPAHLDAECLSAIGRLHRAGALTAPTVERLVLQLASAPIVRHPVNELLVGAWQRRSNLRLVDAIYVELANQLDMSLITTDNRLRSIERVEVIG
jgi:predicted nucleic acid-binding protein